MSLMNLIGVIGRNESELIQEESKRTIAPTHSATKPMMQHERERVIQWLNAIEEHDAEERERVLHKCETDIGARNFCFRQFETEVLFRSQ